MNNYVVSIHYVWLSNLGYVQSQGKEGMKNKKRKKRKKDQNVARSEQRWIFSIDAYWRVLGIFLV